MIKNNSKNQNLRHYYVTFLSFSFVCKKNEEEESRTYKSELIKCFKFYDKEDFENRNRILIFWKLRNSMLLRFSLLLRHYFRIPLSGTIGKAISVAMMPFYIGGYWTIPILPINKELYKQKWNKPLAMIQSFLIPIVVSNCYVIHLT